MWSGPIEGCRCPVTSTVLPEPAQEHLLVRGESAFAPFGRILAPYLWGSTLHGTILTLFRNFSRAPQAPSRAGTWWWPQRGPSLCRVAPGETSGLPQPLPADVQQLSLFSVDLIPSLTDTTPIAIDWMRTVHNFSETMRPGMSF